MQKLQWMSGLSLLTLLLVSCTNSKVTTAPTPKPSEESVSLAPTPSVSSSSANVVPKGLIPPTNPRTLNIPQGRVDPFGSVAVTPIKQSVPAEATQSTETQAPKTQDSKSKTPKNQNSKIQSPQNQSSKTPSLKNQDSKIQAPQNQDTKPPSIKNQELQNQTGEVKTKLSSDSQTIIQNQPFPPAPSTDLARAVEVSGVMNLGGRLRAIVKEPNETISRSVSEGDYLARGAVTVKRIQMNSDREPVVILEQNGIEVIKPISSTNEPIASIQ